MRLEVPAVSVGLEGRTLNGMAFTLYGGRATWDYAGKSAGGEDTAWVDDNLPAGATPYATGDTWFWTAGHTPGTAYQAIAGQQPFCTWTIENPIPGNYNVVRVTEARGAKSYVADYTYRTDLRAVGNGWDMVVDTGKRKERRTKTANTGVGADNTETYTIMDTSASDAVKYKELRTYHNYPWSEELSNLTVGTGPNALSTTRPAGGTWDRCLPSGSG